MVQFKQLVAKSIFARSKFLRVFLLYALILILALIGLPRIFAPGLVWFTQKSENPLTPKEALKKEKYGYLLFGPYMQFDPGEYKVAFTLKTGNNKVAQPVAVVDVADGGEQLAQWGVAGTDFISKDKYQDFSFKFDASATLSNAEFRVYYIDCASLWVDKIVVTSLDGEKSEVFEAENACFGHHVGREVFDWKASGRRAWAVAVPDPKIWPRLLLLFEIGLILGLSSDLVFRYAEKGRYLNAYSKVFLILVTAGMLATIFFGNLSILGSKLRVRHFLILYLLFNLLLWLDFRVSIVHGLLLLLSGCPILLITENPILANGVAIVSFTLLIIGVFLGFVQSLKEKVWHKSDS